VSESVVIDDYRKEWRRQFAEMVSRPDEEIDLARAALLVAAVEYPRLDTQHYLDRLDQFGDLARDFAGGAQDSFDYISAINRALFEVLGFRGNRENYHDPRNSFLNEVIDRRTGIPITLTVVYIEVARRVGFPVQGVGMPMHFIARHDRGGDEIFIDAFNEGTLLGRKGCAELLANMSDGLLKLQPEHLRAATKKQILTRMLSNLLKIYADGNDYHRLLDMLERLLIINPDSPPHVRDHGLLLAALERPGEAVAELERYLALAPDAADAETIREQIKIIRKSQAKWN
jgi:regulator of sirC expression with transglutaminase-like and TPR domain